MASWSLEGLSEAQISEINEKAIPINIKKATKFVFGVLQGRVLVLIFVLCHNFMREAEIVMLTWNSYQLLVCLQISKYGIKKQRL